MIKLFRKLYKHKQLSKHLIVCRYCSQMEKICFEGNLMLQSDVSIKFMLGEGLYVKSRRGATKAPIN